MNELISVINENNELLVSGRELHDKLEIGKVFGAWIPKMLEYGFEENMDYIILWSDSKNGNAVEYNGSPQKMSALGYIKDYILKLDCAKEICMLQRNDLGREFRKYFIECESKLKSQVPQLSEKDKIAIALMNGGIDAIEGAKRLVELETKPLLDKIEKDEPLVAFADQVLKDGDNILIRELAKIASDNLKIKIGQNKLYEKLREWNYILKSSTEPTQKSMDLGYFIVETKIINTPYGTKQVFTSLVTPKGQIKIVEKLRKDKNNN